jgi:hypothetical protein
MKFAGPNFSGMDEKLKPRLSPDISTSLGNQQDKMLDK